MSPPTLYQPDILTLRLNMSSHVLRLPELLALIFENLRDDRLSLRSACLVNHLWFEEATNVLWRKTPSAALRRVGSSRRQIYANKSHSFTKDRHLYDPDNIYSHMQRLTWPQLRYLYLDEARTGWCYKISPWHGQSFVYQYLQPMLKEVDIRKGCLMACLRDIVVSDLPRLRKLGLSQGDQCLNPKDLISFLKKLPLLNSISIGHEMDRVVTLETINYLMSRRGLLELRLDTVVGRETMEKAYALATAPFRDLKSLRIRVKSKAVSWLVQTMSYSTLKELYLQVEDSRDPILNQVSSLTQLQVLGVTYIQTDFRETHEIPAGEIISLRCLTQLHTLELGVDVWIGAFGFKEKDLEILTSALKQLRRFSFHISHSLPVSALLTIAKSCPALEELVFWGFYNVEALALAHDVEFSSLLRLELQSLTDGVFLDSTLQPTPCCNQVFHKRT